MVRIFNNKGELIGTSRNLAGINARCRKLRYGVDEVSVTPKAFGGANLFVRRDDGSWTATDFGSYHLCVKYAMTKRFDAAASKQRRLINPQHKVGEPA